tara:strand:+ start:260 stop:436 length:177 start_codon:yes stop_codon:yes gene_type:complete
MKLGDLVRKTKGTLDVDTIGVVLEITTNSNGITVVTVKTQGEVKNWWSEYIEVISNVV